VFAFLIYEQTKTFTPSLTKSSPSFSLPSSPPTPPSVTFNLEMNTIHRYEADGSELPLPPSSCGSSSSSWRSAIRISTYSSVAACRQELVEAAGDNITELRATGGNQGYNAYGRYVDHLISAIAVRKHHVSVKLSCLSSASTGPWFFTPAASLDTTVLLRLSSRQQDKKRKRQLCWGAKTVWV